MTTSKAPALADAGTPAQSNAVQSNHTMESRDVVMARLRHFDLRRLPPPPASGEEWRDRAIRMCEGMRDLREHLTSVPIGWFGLLEVAVAESRRLLPAEQQVCTSQMKEKYGTLRWYCHVEVELDGWDYQSPAIAPMEWAEDLSGQVCAALGTSDGAMDSTGGYFLTLSPLARRMRQSSTRNHGTGLSAIMYPAWADT